MMRLTLILVACSCLLAGASLDLFHVSPEQERRNLAQWQRMAEAERDGLRRAWRQLSALEPSQRELTQRRMATVSRLLSRHLQRTGEALTQAGLVRLLQEYPDRLEATLDRLGLPRGTLQERLEGRTKRLLMSFLEGLSEQGRLDDTQRQRLQGLPYPSLVAEVLDLQKREEIYLLAEGTQPFQTVDVVRLQQLDPLEVADQMREARRRQGLLGRASRLFGLTEADRTWLAEVSDEDLVKALRTVYEPKVRAHLEEKNWDQDEIARILSQPLRNLERTLDRIERTGR